VQVGEEDQALAARGERLVLQPHVVADGPEVIAEVGLASGLDAGNDAHYWAVSLFVRRAIRSRSTAPITKATPK
jgi:hypothetical protein